MAQTRKNNPGESLEKQKKKTKTVVNSSSQKTTAEYILHLMDVAALQKIDLKDSEQVLNRTMEYFNLCVQNGRNPSWEGYALSLGTNRMTLWQMLTGKKKAPSDVLEILNRTHSMLNAQMVDLATDGKVNPVMAIFLLRNNMGYSNDDTSSKETVLSAAEELDSKAISAKYENILD